MAEGDYMSDAFLEQLVDVRPGLAKKRKKQDVRGNKDRVPKCKRARTAEAEAREQGLSKPIAPDNRGFSLLTKMGYSLGAGLGKTGGLTAVGEGRTAPIPLVVKDGRVGLGRKAFLEQKHSEKQQQDAWSLNEFQQRKQSGSATRKINNDLRKSRLTCVQLDSKLGIAEPDVRWFWPEELLPVEERDDHSDSEDDTPDAAVQLVALTEHLRRTHFYCVWCGTAFESEQDMELNCPGNTADAHD